MAGPTWNRPALLDARTHLAGSEPERLLGFSVLDPTPALADGFLERSVKPMREEARRCHHELGLHGVRTVPAGWYPNDAALVSLHRDLAELGMYVVFHGGAFLDAFGSSCCRPPFFGSVHRVRELRVRPAEVGRPWADECVAVLAQEETVYGDAPAERRMRCDMPFGASGGGQQRTWQHAVDSVSPGALIHGSDAFRPTDPDGYREQYLQPQPAHSEAASNAGHPAGEGSEERVAPRRKTFRDTVWEHWCNAVREPQRPRPSDTSLCPPKALTQHGTVSGGGS
ncbi:hypothetical protein GCM10010145_65000 [Streptomyces ruber]|uniref:Amidohydrolase-related domain-containing protein n=2 Tax=Streptomyces TaxID=1883 RepID=A0A918EXF6_9ACTN|nr:amidohydrolase family protein [Streptomyces ruber]GGQ86516.1 hypothetical protein GCM10010145_65000 [Streptomyces ruber]